ncbi:thermonuclease family protein [Marinivivus vitaminiproducens]|uniref:thermonuclease family protein n=1 Tax=Marinivivus vitaminiproducens TaxID=3035935 RepID=UPI0027A67455|nr:thermonuclease family protein [Geminicoccaceae bacterium SCSIO 64248]
MAHRGAPWLALAILPLAACAQFPFELPQALTGSPPETAPSTVALADPVSGIPIPKPKPDPQLAANVSEPAAAPADPQPAADDAPPRRPRVTAKAGDTLSGQATVVDGDTIEVAGAEVQLLGIDAPETGQTCEAKGDVYDCGEQATNTLEGLIGNASVNCAVRDVDFREHAIATCRRDAVDLAQAMVSEGWAVASYGYSAPYANEEKQASGAGIGIWQGRFDMPWDWRVGIRNAMASSPSAPKG